MLFDVHSTGRVVGLRLASGSGVVVKMLPARWTPAFLCAVQRVQRALWDKGFPCPAPLGVLGSTVFESLLPDTGAVRPSGSLLGVSATGLCRQIALARGVDGAGLDRHPLGDVEGGGLYPRPHSDLFDFDATADGAKWIDELAARSKELRRSGGLPVVIAHTDWSARNVRLGPDGVIAAYDWDSLALVPEAQAVGQAAATWSATGEGDEAAPTVEETAAYVRAYEQARGVAFSREEWAVAGASVVWTLAYTARCEHAVDPEERLHRRARPRLRADAARLLALSSEL